MVVLAHAFHGSMDLMRPVSPPYIHMAFSTLRIDVNIAVDSYRYRQILESRPRVPPGSSPPPPFTALAVPPQSSHVQIQFLTLLIRLQTAESRNLLNVGR